MVKQSLASGKYQDQFDAYPFNSGYFVCLKLKNIKAEVLRQKLLANQGIGTIAISEYALRLAFSSVEKEDIPTFTRFNLPSLQ